jgi:hypothetical protein
MGRAGTWAGTLVRAVITASAVVAVLLLLGGCAHTGQTSDGTPEADTRVHRVPNDLDRVAWKRGGVWRVRQPPRLEFTGRTATGAEIRQWARDNGITAVGVAADTRYAQIEAESAIRLALWTKRLAHDIGYDYIGEARDCDNFARLARTIPDLFAGRAPNGAQAGVFGIWAEMGESFAGVTDGYHALNVAWTGKGVPVFEPQGLDLTYQDIRAWPNKSGISHVRYD